MRETAPFGSWKSPFTPELLTSGSVGLSSIEADAGENSTTLYWTESRPWEKGFTFIVCRTPDGTVSDLTDATYNVRSRVHEYGGAPYTVDNGDVWFSNAVDNRVYRIRHGGKPAALTKPSKAVFADFVVDRRHNRLICVKEDHANDSEPTNSIVSIDLSNGSVTDLVTGSDFYAFPRLSPDGGQLSWIEWDHPNMPWDGTRLLAAILDANGQANDPLTIAGGPDESIFQPSWTETGSLVYASDRSGFWNLYRVDSEERHFNAEADFGLPMWQLGMCTYAHLSDDRLICSFAQNGDWRLATLDTGSGNLQPLDVHWVTFNAIRATSDRVWFIGGRADAPEELVELDISSGEFTVIRPSATLSMPVESISTAQPISFKTSGNNTAHAYYYPPASAEFEGQAGEKPPLIVKSHGGPTGQATRALSLKIQYWTSRGFGVVDVNYGGSTGYGRDYRRRLDGNWGITDVDDCVNAAQYLAAQGAVDPDRMIITGGSAGGFTTLCALTFRDTFKAGCSSYGIGDLEALARDTHKFESRYLDRLIGEWPKNAAVYRDRSPIHHLDGLSCPVIFLQGSEDKVVPPNQAESMVEALDEKGLPVAYILFDQEGHGFRQAENVKRALEAELSFYAQIFGFDPADPIEPVQIRNLSQEGRHD
ncbi:MAG: prolyl oligopeptidase family serine peptidase [Alphaproteobacteria bacterium]